MSIRIPGEEKLAPGPKRDLVIALHHLYVLAGAPAARAISGWIREQDELPGTLSHEGVSAVLRGQSVPRWANLKSLVHVLVQRQCVDEPQNIEVVEKQIHALWGTVCSGLPAPGTSTSAATTEGEGRGRGSSPQHALIRWNSGLGTVDFSDRQTAVEFFKELGGFDDQP
ncbi:hypothetical protein ABZ413_17285 [Nocardia rhamnosiphila]|uniref:hypothetical protein n=1 Tax=Nocardia rhamnosiphila TaxID=426716 RepID=UPI0033E06EFF